MASGSVISRHSPLLFRRLLKQTVNVIVTMTIKTTAHEALTGIVGKDFEVPGKDSSKGPVKYKIFTQ